MRKSRFDPSVPIVHQKDFYKSNFLKYYDRTPKDPKYSNVIKSLQELDDGNGDFQALIEALAESSSEYDVIQTYSSEITVGTKAFYTYINEQLYNDDDYIMWKLMPLIRRATLQINDNAPSRSCVVYRAKNLDNHQKRFFTIGEIFRFPGFVSTSKCRKKAQQFGNTLFAINIDSGCLQVRDISDISYHPEEEEYLFSPYSLFEVVDKNDEIITLQAHDNMRDIGMNPENRITHKKAMKRMPSFDGKASKNSCCIQ